MRIVRHSGHSRAVTPPTISPGGRILLTLKIRAPPISYDRLTLIAQCVIMDHYAY